MPGCFVAFEGTEGSGKSSQMRRAEAWLSPLVDLVVTREPGGTPTAERMRSVVLSMTDEGRDGSTDAFLMNAARRDHCRRVISPALERGAVVLSDRFAASTMAYQGAGDGVPLDWLASLERLATGGLSPDRYVLFDLDVVVGLARRNVAGDLNAIDRRDVAFHRRVRSGYLDLAGATPEEWTVIDAAVGEVTVWTQVRSAISDALSACGVRLAK
ncbi:MAG: dTMP kinase [Chloroflexota bacterium]|nr:dTMP kinase [Chloroflexota bacterium]